MSYNLCKASIFLDILEFIFKPFNLFSWITSVVKKPPIEIVASLHVKSNNSSLLVELKWL